MNNACQFSRCRRYRYSLTHEIDSLPLADARQIMWVGLNPSTADENELDPTLRRVRAFTMREGGTSFVMTNLFAWRDTKPAGMKAAVDPVGPLNDRVLLAQAAASALIVCAWGTDGDYRYRASNVLHLLRDFPLRCLGKNGDGSPKHPLYVAGNTPFVAYP